MKWFEKSYRRSLMDMHIDDWDETFLSQYNPEEYINALKDARVQSAMIPTISLTGGCYWPTSSGHMHRGLKGRDVLGEAIELCHKNDMDVIVYYNLIYNNKAFASNPSWRILDINGSDTRKYKGLLGRYGTCCPNSLGYRKLVCEQLQELCLGYDFEGFFLDMTLWPAVCYCNSCRKRYKEEKGAEIPSILDWGKKNWTDFQKRREDWLVEFAAMATQCVKKLKPNATLAHNSAAYPLDWWFGSSEGLIMQSDYLSGDFYGGFVQNSFICKLFYNISTTKPFEFMTCRCDPFVSEHTNFKPQSMLMASVFMAMAHDGAFLFIDAIDPLGTFNKEIYEVIGRIFEQTIPFEKHLGGELIQDVAVYFSSTSKMNLNKNGEKVPIGSEVVVQTNYGEEPHLDAAVGCVRNLRDGHIPFGVIGRRNLANLAQYKVVVLPQVVVLDQEEADAMLKYVSEGGSIYISGCPSVEFVREVAGIMIKGQIDETYSYITPTDQGRELLCRISSRYPMAVNARQFLATSFSQSRMNVLATITLPYTNPDDGTKYASMHSNPPGIKTEHPAVANCGYGRGKTTWVASAIEVSKDTSSKNVFRDVIADLCQGGFSFQADAPSEVEFTVFHQPENHRYIVNILNEQESFPQIPVYNMTFCLTMKDQKVKSVQMQPGGDLLEYKMKEGQLQIQIPRLDIYLMISINYEKKILCEFARTIGNNPWRM